MRNQLKLVKCVKKIISKLFCDNLLTGEISHIAHTKPKWYMEESKCRNLTPFS